MRWRTYIFEDKIEFKKIPSLSVSGSGEGNTRAVFDCARVTLVEARFIRGVCNFSNVQKSKG
jgi:hypothetical protein